MARIIEASTEILTPISQFGQNELRQIEAVGRTCYKSEQSAFDYNATKKFVSNLIERGHEAMLEHSQLSIKFIVDRGVSHELVRHRLMSFAQESTRYCNYANDKFGNELTFIRPCFWGEDSTEMSIWENQMLAAEAAYMQLTSAGVPPEQARSVLPNSLKTEIVLTGNYREWRHFFKLRAIGLTGKPHPQMLEVTIPLLATLQAKLPVVFDNLVDDDV